MTRRRVLVLLFGVTIATVVLASGTFGASVVELDRGITGTVADDESAYVGLNQTVTTDNGTVNVTLAVKNNQPSTTITEITVLSNGDQLTTTSERLPPDDQTTLRVTEIDCGVDLRIDISGSGGTNTLWRTTNCQ